MKNKHLVVIDPAMKTAEIDCFNRLSLVSPLPLTYHLPAIFGMQTLEREREGIAGIIVLGSMSSVYDRHPWQEKLECWLKPRFEAKTPTFGICYGHQMIAHMYGGKIGYLFPDQHKLIGFQTTELADNPLWGKAVSGPVYVSHREVVTEKPSCMIATAQRGEVKYDGLMHQSLPIWTFQSHPEAVPNFLKEEGVTEKADPKQFQFGHDLLQKFLAFVKDKS